MRDEIKKILNTIDGVEVLSNIKVPEKLIPGMKIVILPEGELDEEDYTIGPSANYDMRLDFDIEIACAAKTEEEAGKNRDILVKAIGDKLSAADIPGIEYLSISAPKQNSIDREWGTHLVASVVLPVSLHYISDTNY